MAQHLLHFETLSAWITYIIEIKVAWSVCEHFVLLVYKPYWASLFWDTFFSAYFLSFISLLQKGFRRRIAIDNFPFFKLLLVSEGFIETFFEADENNSKKLKNLKLYCTLKVVSDKLLYILKRLKILFIFFKQLKFFSRWAPRRMLVWQSLELIINAFTS